MADATLLPTVSPKDLGKQLRAVRRRKGLSLSEVARGAGLSRRELVAYERGKVEIPESDLWVIAGSCGVDVAELVPPTDPKSLSAAPETIEDTISQLRSGHPDGMQRHLDTLYALRALPPGSVVQLQERERVAIADALGHDPASIEARLVETMRVSRAEARRLRALVVPDSPLALDAPPTPEPEPEPAPVPAAAMSLETRFEAVAISGPDLPTGPVDVFEELAKLPEPVALTDERPGDHDVFSPPPEPVSVHAAADAADAAGGFATWSSIRSALPDPSSPVVVEPTASVAAPSSPTFGAYQAAPIDVVGRPDVSTSPGPGGVGTDAFDSPGGDAPPGWEPPAPGEMSWDAWLPSADTPPEHIVEFVDDYVVVDDGSVDELTD
ncbi:MAG: helix-turn-helix domain-containing protein, partial [Acidimicrobiia bacterium]